MNGSYDVARIRQDFPILSMQVYGKPLVYLDNAASAQKPNAVLDRIQQAYTSEYANVHRGLHYLANAAYPPASLSPVKNNLSASNRTPLPALTNSSRNRETAWSSKVIAHCCSYSFSGSTAGEATCRYRVSVESPSSEMKLILPPRFCACALRHSFAKKCSNAASRNERNFPLFRSTARR